MGLAVIQGVNEGRIPGHGHITHDDIVGSLSRIRTPCVGEVIVIINVQSLIGDIVISMVY